MNKVFKICTEQIKKARTPVVFSLVRFSSNLELVLWAGKNVYCRKTIGRNHRKTIFGAYTSEKSAQPETIFGPRCSQSLPHKIYFKVDKKAKNT
jgi:hypothetical protein